MSTSTESFDHLASLIRLAAKQRSGRSPNRGLVMGRSTLLCRIADAAVHNIWRPGVEGDLVADPVEGDGVSRIDGDGRVVARDREPGAVTMRDDCHRVAPDR